MKKTFIAKIISAGAIITTLATVAPLGVSAAWKQSSNNTWSYVQNNKAVTGWKQISNKWYYFDANGKMKTGWVKDNGNWYYLDKSGAMKTGWVQSNGNWYYLNKSGAMKTGWIYDNGTWYYADSTGAMQTGVLKINGTTYYLNSSGAMQTGNVVINNKVYTFASNGAAIGTIPACDKQFNANNVLVKPSTGGSINSGNTNSGTTNNGSTNSGTTNNGSTNSGNTNSGTTNNGTTTNNSLNVSGLPQVTQKYSATIQSSAEAEILRLMNEKRTEAGLQPLTLDNTLVSVARYKSNHMIQNDYFSHTNPDGTKWTNWLQALGYSYTTTGENIAYNTYDAVELFNQWWNSQGHRDNMMNPNYTKVGIGVVLGNGKYMGTQTFAK